MAKIAKMVTPVIRAAKYGEKDVWAIFTPLANEFKAVNLGQGFPNLPAPTFIKDGLCEATQKNLNQYAPSKGLLSLRNSLSKAYTKNLGMPIDPESNVLVTQGANQGMCVIMQAFIEQDDEVIMIEPYFDIFKPSVEVTGGKTVTVKLNLSQPFNKKISANDWRLDMGELRSKISPRTKAIILNTPHNPTGKVFNETELKEIADIAKEHNLLVISDEVYDNIYYTPNRPKSIACLPGMWDRTLTIGSAGKTFGITGWRLGWVLGHPELLKWVTRVHAKTVFAAQTPGQEAIANGFEEGERSGFFDQQRSDYRRRRDRLVEAFEKLGFPVAVPDAGYFFIVNMDRLKVKLEPELWAESADPMEREPNDYSICRWLTKEIGVTAIPPSAFYEPANRYLAANWVRICFCKDDATIDMAIERLQKLRKYM